MISKCYFCLCPACNMLSCRYNTSFSRCLWCVSDNAKRPTLYCDFWQSKIKRKAYKIKRKQNNKYQEINKKLDILIKKLDDGRASASINLDLLKKFE